jgi:prepilin-type N-terminal cleavage/methylation domain-containing protein
MGSRRSARFRPPGSAAKGRRAFTLIEAITAVVILSIAMPAMLWSIRDSVRRRADPVFLSRARWLAAEKLEDCIADSHSPTRGYSYLVSGNYAAETPVTGFTGFNRSVAIVETAPKFIAGTGWKTVTVTVSYTDGRGVARSLALSTVLTSYTP